MQAIEEMKKQPESWIVVAYTCPEVIQKGGRGKLELLRQESTMYGKDTSQAAAREHDRVSINSGYFGTQTDIQWPPASTTLAYLYHSFELLLGMYRLQ